jgi:hypothetical protein
VSCSLTREKKIEHIKQLMRPPNKFTFASSVFPVPGAPVKSMPCKKRENLLKNKIYNSSISQ